MYGDPCNRGGVLRPRHEVHKVLRLVAEGWNDCEISRATGISRTTIRGWRRDGPPGRRRLTSGTCPICDGSSLDEPAYAYLLGLYLGDGWITRHPRAYRLRIVQDARYPHLIDLAQHTIARVRAGKGAVGTVDKVGCVEICSYWQHWPCLFPQHGPGRKHQRIIALRPWHGCITQRYPRQLLRGLIHSDGCRAINRVWNGKYAYPRYFFTNNSGDIRQIFREACDTIGVRHRNSKPNTISIARRDDVATLDAFIGPKA